MPDYLEPDQTWFILITYDLIQILPHLNPIWSNTWPTHDPDQHNWRRVKKKKIGHWKEINLEYFILTFILAFFYGNPYYCATISIFFKQNNNIRSDIMRGVLGAKNDNEVHYPKFVDIIDHLFFVWTKYFEITAIVGTKSFYDLLNIFFPNTGTLHNSLALSNNQMHG